MPLALEPGAEFPVVLDSDRDKSKEVQPTFWCRVQPMRGQQSVAKVVDLWTDTPDISADELFQKTIDELFRVTARWSNMGPYQLESADSFRDVLTYNEARELLFKVMYNQHITHEEKKS